MRNTILELRNKKAKAWEDAKAFLDAHHREDGTLSASDAAVYDKLEAKIVDLGTEISRMERLNDYEAEMEKPTSKPLCCTPGSALYDVAGRASNAYKCAMQDAIRSNFHQVSDVLIEGSDTAGGFLVPTEYDARLIEKLEEGDVLRRLATVIQTTGERKINVAASKPAASWVEEGGALVFSDAAFSQVILDAYKLSVAVKVSEELLADNQYDLENFLIRSFGQAIADAEEDAFLNGNGVSKPTGILDANGGGEVGITTAGASITADEIIELVYKLKRPYREKAAFIMADSTLAKIRKLKDSTGQYLWQPGLQAGEPDRLLNYPVYTSAHMPSIAAGNSVIAFGDFSYYNIGDRGIRSIAALRELYAGVGQVAFVCKQRVDGKLVLPEAVQIMKMKG